MASGRIVATWIPAVAIAAIGLPGCAPPPPPPPGAVTLDDVIAADLLAGEWEWQHEEREAGTVRREREFWTLSPSSDRRGLHGHYRREVVVRALDGVPFACSQRDTYQLRADHEVAVRIIRGEAIVEERGYRTAPSPCEPGLRQETVYLAKVRLDRLTLRWNGGESRLVRARPGAPPAVAEFSDRSQPLPGRWSWAMTSWTRAGLIQEESEVWELATRGDRLTGTYVRTTAVRAPDGASMSCAQAPEFRYVDRYLLEGKRDQDKWRIEEVGYQAGSHPCLVATPSRSRDSATAAVEGDYLVLEWRGKRRQVLGRWSAVENAERGE